MTDTLYLPASEGEMYGNLKITRLNREQIAEIFTQHMKADFPPDELKPLKMMMKMLDDGVYDCLGLFENDLLSGYAYLIRIGKNCLLDYFAVVRGKRSQGYGSLFLQQLKEYLKDEELLMIESEDPDFSEGEEDYATRCRRVDFYLKNGFRDTGARALLFGVRYVLLEPDCDSHSREEICDSYYAHYRAVLSDKLYNENVEIH